MIRRLSLVILTLVLAGLACNLTNEENVSNEKLVTEERPALVLLAPANQNRYQAGATVTFHAIARDIVDGVARIEFIIDVPGDTQTLIENSEDPQGDAQLEAILEWTAFGNQTYIVEVRAYRADGTPSNTEQIIIEVVDDNATATLDTSTQEDDAGPTPIEALQFDIPETGITGTIMADAVPVRQGPDTSVYPIVRELNSGDEVPIAGRSVDDLWYVVQLSDGYGYVLQMMIQPDGDTTNLPPIEPPAPAE
jgi:hypothetical protein